MNIAFKITMEFIKHQSVGPFKEPENIDIIILYQLY
jgi:hypothetical protein